MDKIKNVKLVTADYGRHEGEVIDIRLLGEEMTKEELKKTPINVDSASLTNCEVVLEWEGETGKHSVSIANYTSDIPTEWYVFATSDFIIQASIDDDADYTFEYNDRRLRAESEDGRVLTQEEFVKEMRAARDGNVPMVSPEQ